MSSLVLQGLPKNLPVLQFSHKHFTSMMNVEYCAKLCDFDSDPFLREDYINEIRQIGQLSYKNHCYSSDDMTTGLAIRDNFLAILD